VICTVVTLSEEADWMESTPGTDMTAASMGRVTSSSMSAGVAPL